MKYDRAPRSTSRSEIRVQVRRPRTSRNLATAEDVLDAVRRVVEGRATDVWTALEVDVSDRWVESVLRDLVAAGSVVRRRGPRGEWLYRSSG